MVRGAVDGVVKAHVLIRGFLLGEHPRARFAELVQDSVDGGEVVFGGELGGALDGQSLERQAQAVDLVEIAAGQPRDDRPAVATEEHQSLALELDQRFANGSAADFEHAGQLDFAQVLTRREFAAQDGRAQLLVDLLAEMVAGRRWT